MARSGIAAAALSGGRIAVLGVTAAASNGRWHGSWRGVVGAAAAAGAPSRRLPQWVAGRALLRPGLPLSALVVLTRAAAGARGSLAP